VRSYPTGVIRPQLPEPHGGAGTPNNFIGASATGASRGRGVLTEDGAFRNTLQKKRSNTKAHSHLILYFIQIYVTYHEKLCVSYISLFL
jgi:hypothetical protein